MNRVLVFVGLASLALAGLLLVVAGRTPWAPQTSFDVLGILWLLQNAPKLFAWAVALALSALGVWALLLGATGRGWRFGRRAEETRMAADPRFGTPPGWTKRDPGPGPDRPPEP